MGRPVDVPVVSLQQNLEVSETDDFGIQNGEFCIKNEGLCLENAEFCSAVARIAYQPDTAVRR